ncbi:MAG: ABC transporter substrate-binding protein [Spirochaetales bacterium]
MRKLFTVFVVLLIAAAAFATGTQEETIRIGISKIVSHPALDAVEQGIKDELAELGYTDIVFDVQSANGDISTANQIATKFRNDRVDVAVGIATPTAQALVNAITDIPVVYTAVTDPVGAGIVPSLEGDGGNVTGYSDLTPVREQIGLIGQLDGVSAIGHVYSSGEANAVVLAEMAAEAAEEIGVEFLTTTVTNTAEVRQATESIVDRVDIFYMSTDNTVVSALAALTEVANAAGVPVMTADPSSAEEQDVIGAYGFDYYTMGRATGALIAEILEGADPNEIPVQYLTDADDLVLHINLDVAERLGIVIPDAIIEAADQVVENGAMRRQ